ncbi:MAG: hypothetical protein ACTS7C_00490, partial [Candidatus Hodgkinia cicadicola]
IILLIYFKFGWQYNDPSLSHLKKYLSIHFYKTLSNVLSKFYYLCLAQLRRQPLIGTYQTLTTAAQTYT